MANDVIKAVSKPGAPEVALVKCDDYAPERVDAALERALALSGGLEGIVRPGMRVFIKCNLVMRKPPEAAATTHPEVVRALAERVRRLGATPVIGDSPGGALGPAMLRGYYAATGMADAAARAGAELSLDDSQHARDCPDGRTLRRMAITGMALDCDAVISCSKLKTHGMTLMTGCVKNLFGCVPGVTKIEYHARFSRIEQFSDMLVDIERCVRPALSVLDAVDGMEGEGPSGGSPRHIGALLVSRDAHALDSVAARLIGLKPDAVCTLARAIERGLLDPGEVRVWGEDVARLAIADFVYPRAARDIRFFSTNPLLGPLVNRIAMPSPAFDRAKCAKCGLCARSCPAGAIALAPYPRADLRRCIRCFCCQELCPVHAVDVRKSILRRIIR